MTGRGKRRGGHIPGGTSMEEAADMCSGVHTSTTSIGESPSLTRVLQGFSDNFPLPKLELQLSSMTVGYLPNTATWGNASHEPPGMD